MNSEKKNKMIIYDFVFGIILICSSTFFCYRSIMLARPRGWLTAPGLPPLLIHSSLGLMGIVLLAGSIREEGFKIIKEKILELKLAAALKQNLLINKTTLLVIIFFLYLLVLVRIFPFELSTFIYLFAFFKIFWKRSFLITVIASIATTIAFDLVFTNIFKVMLPGVAWEDFLPFLF